MTRKPPADRESDGASSLTSYRARTMLHRRQHDELAQESEEWVISYMDMVTLLMTVFLVIAAILSIHRPPDADPGNGKPTPLAAAAAGQGVLQNTAGLKTGDGEDEDEAPALPLPPPQPKPDRQDAADQRNADAWRKSLAAEGLTNSADVMVKDRQVIIEIKERILFQTGQADLGAEGGAVLGRLAGLLQKSGGKVSVEGHTDDVPIASARFPSNWELSSARATAVVHALIDAGLPADRLRAIGYADTRPLAANDSPDNRALNRRVSLVVEQ